ncbi:MAG: phosphotransferase, partial [Flavobacteriaceae bacterium]|nr:phosphotransferase [Flavobacteriaceae bacterium]
SQVAYEAGKATGNFLALTADIDASKLVVILPDFHVVSARYLQFKNALSKATKERKESAKELIDFTINHIDEMLELDKAINSKKLSHRVIHSDTKISNVLFSKADTYLCMIDTDTVMEGVIHYDYGDAIRTICNSADEDATDLETIKFNMEYFQMFTKGFIEEIKESVSTEDLNYLSVSIKTMPFIIGLRFLTDFLNNDIYYKTSHKYHNFDRARNQYTFVLQIKNSYSEIENFIKSSF